MCRFVCVSVQQSTLSLWPMLCLSEGMCTGMGISSAQSASVAFFEHAFSRIHIHCDNLCTCVGPGTETWEKWLRTSAVHRSILAVLARIKHSFRQQAA